MYIIHKWTLFPLRRTYLDSTCLQSDNISTNFRLAPFHFTRRFAWTLKLVSLSELRLQQEMSLFWRVWSDRTFEKNFEFSSGLTALGKFKRNLYPKRKLTFIFEVPTTFISSECLNYHHCCTQEVNGFITTPNKFFFRKLLIDHVWSRVRHFIVVRALHKAYKLHVWH